MSKSNMNLKLVAGLLVASGSTAAMASMNNLNVQSHLGERFNGTIVVTGPTAQEILKSPSSVKVSGAAISARVSKQGTAAVIHLRSKAPINDPVLRLNVQAGTESRHYSAIIDPKDSVHQSAQVNASKAIPAVPTTATNNAQVTTPEKSKAADSKQSVATPATSTDKPAAGVAQADAATVKAEAKKPATAMPRVNKRTIQNNRAARKTNTMPAPVVNVAAAEQYKVQANDSIYEIASRVQPQGLSTAQTAKALMRANPQAFRNKNPNLLYGDATLNIPSAEDMHALATGRSPQKTAANTAAPAPKPSTVTTGQAAAAATAIGATAIASADASEDVRALQKQLAELESKKKQLEQKLTQELAEAEAEKKATAQAALEAQKKAAAQAEADKQAAEQKQKEAAAEAASKPVITAPETAASDVVTTTIASAPVAASAAASTPVASEPVVAKPSKPKKPKPLPEPEPEPSLLDLIIANWPYLAGGLITLLLAAWLIKQRQKKNNPDDGPDGPDGDDDSDIEFELDEATTGKNHETNTKARKSDDAEDDDKLTDAEWDALNAFDAFDANDDDALRLSTAKPTVAPQKENSMATGAAIVGAAAVAGAAYANNTPDDDFMPSAAELAEFGQPATTVAPELDDFNLDDLDQLFQPSNTQFTATDSAATPTSTKDSLDDFDLNELDGLLAKNGFGEQTPAPIQNFAATAVGDDSKLDFDLDEVLQNTESFAQPSIAHDFALNTDTSTTPEANNVATASFNDFNFDDLDNLDDAPTAPSQTTTRSALGDFDLDDDFEANILAAGKTDDLSHVTTSPTQSVSLNEAGLTLSQADINNINFDLDAFNLDEISDQTTTLTPTASPLASLAAVAATGVAAAAIAHTSNPSHADATDDFDAAFDLNAVDSVNAVSAVPSNTTEDAGLALNLDELFSQSDDTLSDLDLPTASANDDEEFVSKFSSISLESEHNQLAFDDSFGGLNFDDLLKTDDIPSDIPSTDAASIGAAAFIGLDTTPEPTVAPEFSVHDFKDFSIDAPDKAERPTQAWAGTGDFGLNADATEAAMPSTTATDTDDIDFGSLNLDDALGLDTLIPADSIQTATHDLNLDALLPTGNTNVSLTEAETGSALSFDDAFELPDLATLNASSNTPAPSHTMDLPTSNILAVDDTASNIAATTPADAADLGFDLDLNDLDGMNLNPEPSIQPAPTATPDITTQFDFSMDETVAVLPQETVATPEPEISESLSLDDFDLSFQSPDAHTTSNQVGITLSELDLDAKPSGTNDVEIDLGDFDISLDDAAKTTHSTDTEFSLDDFALSLDTDTSAPNNEASLNAFAATLETDANGSDKSTDLSLDDFDLSLDEVTTHTSTTSSATELSLDDFDLSLDEVTTHASTTSSATELSLDDFDLSSLDKIANHAAPSSSATEISLDDAVLGTDSNLDFSLDGLESFDLASTPSSANTQTTPAANPVDMTLDDFDLSFDLDAPAELGLNGANDILNIDATAAPVTLATAVSETDSGLSFKSPLTEESLFDSDLFKPPVIDPTVAPTHAPNMHAPLAMIETAPPIVDTDAYLNSMDHTYSTKWDLAQMYLDLGDLDASREILADLIENGSESYAKRAQALFNTL